MSHLSELSAELEAWRHRSLSSAVFERAKASLLDTAGLAVLGLQTAEARQTLETFRKTFGRQGDIVPAAMAAQLAMACRITETDDIHIESCVTPGSVVIPTVLAAHTTEDADCVLRALVAGYHVMVRLGLVTDGARGVYRGKWPTCFAAPMASAGALVTLWGGTHAQLASALSIAATLSCEQAGRIPTEPTSRWITLGAAVQNGFLAAVAAMDGLQGDTRLPEPWAASSPEVSAPDRSFLETEMKPFHGSRQSLAAILAFRVLVQQHKLDIDKISAIAVRVPHEYAAMIDRPVPPATKSETRGVQFQIALAAIDEARLFDLDRHPPFPAGAESLARKVRVVGDDALSAAYPKRWGGTVELVAGTDTFTLEISDPVSSGLTPTGMMDIHRKLSRMASHSASNALTRLTRSVEVMDLDGLVAVLKECLAASVH